MPEKTTVVSLGDLVDRGPDGPACYGLMQDLAASSAGAGSRVVRLLGNHEWLNLLGVDQADDPRTPSVQENLLASYVHPEEVQHFSGWAGRKAAFRPDGGIGRAISESFELLALLPAPWRAAGAGSPGGVLPLPPLEAAATLFLHGGLSEDTAKQYPTAEALAAQARTMLERWGASGSPEELLAGGVFDEVLQDRSLAQRSGRGACPELEAILAHFGAARMVLGHTPQIGSARQEALRRASVRCGGRLVLLDVAMSRWLIRMHRPEASPNAAALELTYEEAEDPSGNAMLKDLRVLYAGRGAGDLPSEEHLPPFTDATRSDL